MLFYNGTKPFQFDNRLFRIWYLRRLYFHILKNDMLKLGFKNTAITQFPFAFSDADVPPAITLEFTNLCNLKCSYCTSPLKERPVGLMKNDIFNKIIKDIHLLRISRVRIVGNGEPSIHPDFGNYLLELKRVTPVVQLTSNGNFIKPQVLYDIVDSGINQINVSVDGHTSEVYEHYRPGGKFDKLVEDLKELKAYRDQMKSSLFINIRVMISPSEFNKINEIIAFWQPLGDVVSKQFIIDLNHSTTTGCFKTNDQKDRFPKCSLPFKILDIHWNGNVPLCTYSIKQSGLKEGVLLGNIGTTSLYDLWNHKLIKQYRDAHRNRITEKMPLCNGCIGT